MITFELYWERKCTSKTVKKEFEFCVQKSSFILKLFFNLNNFYKILKDLQFKIIIKCDLKKDKIEFNINNFKITFFFKTELILMIAMCKHTIADTCALVWYRKKNIIKFDDDYCLPSPPCY